MFIDTKSTIAKPVTNLSRFSAARAGAWQDYLRLHHQGVTETTRIVRAASATAHQVAELRKVTTDFFAKMDQVAGRI